MTFLDTTGGPYDTSYPPSLWAPPAPIPATGATAGTPGSWTPAGSARPASVSALQSANPPIAASPTTAWTTGQYVQTDVVGAAGRAYWNGTAWVGGAAPASTATGATAGAPGTFTPSGATTPANLAALASVAASPATAWTTGQHVVLGDASHAYWDADSWEVGEAP